MMQVLIQIFVSDQNKKICDFFEILFLSLVPEKAKFTVFSGVGREVRKSNALLIDEKFNRVESFYSYDIDINGIKFSNIYTMIKLSPTSVMWDDPINWQEKAGRQFHQEKLSSPSKETFKQDTGIDAYPSTVTLRWNTDANFDVIFDTLNTFVEINAKEIHNLLTLFL